MVEQRLNGHLNRPPPKSETTITSLALPLGLNRLAGAFRYRCVGESHAEKGRRTHR